MIIYSIFFDKQASSPQSPMLFSRFFQKNGLTTVESCDILCLMLTKRRDGWVAESNSLLNCRRGNSTAGSNPALSAIFLPKKWRNEDASLLFTRRQPLFTQNRRFSSHLHQTPEKPCLWSRSLWSLVKTFRLRSTCEVAACRRVDVLSFTALRLHGASRLDFFFCGDILLYRRR